MLCRSSELINSCTAEGSTYRRYFSVFADVLGDQALTNLPGEDAQSLSFVLNYLLNYLLSLSLLPFDRIGVDNPFGANGVWLVIELDSS